MCRSNTIRQQTHYQLLGLTFLVRGRVNLHENLHFNVRCFGESMASLGLQTVLCLQASGEEIRVAYKRLALVRLAPSLLVATLLT